MKLKFADSDELDTVAPNTGSDLVLAMDFEASFEEDQELVLVGCQTCSFIEEDSGFDAVYSTTMI